MWEFLADVDVQIKSEDDARKTRLDHADVEKLLDEVREVWVAKGKKFERIRLDSRSVDREELIRKVMGPSGNLRAPTLRMGKKLVVGFHPEMYGELFAKVAK